MVGTEVGEPVGGRSECLEDRPPRPRGVGEGAEETENLGGADKPRKRPQYSGQLERAGMSELLAAVQLGSFRRVWEKGQSPLLCRLAGAAQSSWELGWPWAALTPWALLPFWCRRSQERVSVHPHRLHPSFDFGHQLQTPQPRYLAEGTDW